MALKKEKRFFDYQNRIGVSRGGDFDTMQSYARREAQEFDNLMREQSNIALKELQDAGEERGLLEANRYQITYEDIEVPNSDGTSSTLSIPKKYEVPAGLTGKTAIKTFKTQAHKRYMDELTLSNTKIINEVYNDFASGNGDPAQFNDFLSERLSVVYEQLDPETRTLLKLQDEKDILEKTQRLGFNFQKKRKERFVGEISADNLDIINSRNRFILFDGNVGVKDNYNHQKKYFKNIDELVTNNIISREDAKKLKDDYNDETKSLQSIHDLFKSKFSFLSNNENPTSRDLDNLLKLEQFLTDEKISSVEIDGVTVTKQDVIKSAGKNVNENIKKYKNIMKSKVASYQSSATKTTEKAQIEAGINSFSETQGYVFGTGTGKKKRELATKNQQELYEAWSSRQAGTEKHVPYYKLNEDKETLDKWNIHRFKYGIISNQELNSLLSTLQSNDPDIFLETINSQQLQMIANNYDQYDLTAEQKSLIHKYYDYKDVPQQEQVSRFQIAQERKIPGAQQPQLLTDKLASLVNSDSYNTTTKLFKQVDVSITEYMASRYDDSDVIFNIVAINKVKNEVSRRVMSMDGNQLTKEDIDNMVKNEINELNSPNNKDWGFSEFGKPAVSQPVSFKGGNKVGFVRYPIEKNENVSSILQTNEGKEKLYTIMKAKWKGTLKKKVNGQPLNYFPDNTFIDGYGTQTEPKLGLRGRLKNNGTVEYIIVYYSDGIEYTLQEDANETLTIDDTDLEFLRNE